MGGCGPHLLTLYVAGLLCLLSAAAAASGSSSSCSGKAECELPEDASALLQVSGKVVHASPPSGANATAGVDGFIEAGFAPNMTSDLAGPNISTVSYQNITQVTGYVEELLQDNILDASGPRLALSIVMLVLGICVFPTLAIIACRHCVDELGLKESRCWHITCRLLIGLTLLAAVGAGVACLVWHFAGAMLMKAIQHYDVAYLGVEVQIESLKVNPYIGVIEGTGLTVMNPPNYSSPYLLRVEAFHVDLDMGVLMRSFGKTRVIDQIGVQDVQVVYESKGSTSNVDVLQQRLSSGGSSGSMVVHKVDVSNVTASVSVSLLTGVPVSLAGIHYKDFDRVVGSRGMTAVITRLLKNIFKSTLASVLQR